MTGESPGGADRQESTGATPESNEADGAGEPVALAGGRRTLLDELTNPPPPPPPPPPAETAERTPGIPVWSWFPVLVLLLLAFCGVQAVRPLPAPTLRLTAASSHTFAGEWPSLPWPTEGQAVLEAEGLGRIGASGAQRPVPIASVAKVMTAYVILRDHPIEEGGTGETVEVDRKAEEQYGSGLAAGESVVKVTAGQELSEYEALAAVMLPSANNVARLLARWDAGSEAAFVEKMNAAARELGMDDTTYTDPSGLEATTVSTASDQVRLGHAAMRIPVFAELAAKTRYTDVNGDVQRNVNGLLGSGEVVGIKTGSSTKAGGNLLFAAVREVGGTEQLVVGAVLGQHKAPILDTVLNRSGILLESGLGALLSQPVVRKGEAVGYVDDGLGGHTEVVATQDVRAIGWSGLKVSVSLDAPRGGLPHAAPAGSPVGVLTVGGDGSAVRVPVALGGHLSSPSFGAKLTRLG
ncbi:D-alanyl-D-alanine carboxypeptidase family protein [Actinacidiphila sp. bgisy167]|uniref:D-alanyl-D-alanine carboxypeptidase family protein n=1 Tax=Actinacidiphila sp. bgisy167 TaxID=3413797 RepID=UPI003D7398C5